MTFYYTDDNEQKEVSFEQLVTLYSQGLIAPNTIISDEDGTQETVKVFFNILEKLEKDATSKTQFVSPFVANFLETTPFAQYNKFHTKNGHGFAAEDANALFDTLHGKTVHKVGTSNELNGADRIVNGIQIQTKYCQDASSTLRAACDKNGQYLYNGMVLEVPKGQGAEVISLMEDKIYNGKVPGISDPKEAKKIVQEGIVTYKQARNIARAGNVDSLLFDAKINTVSSSCVGGISFVIGFAIHKWNGESFSEATRNALKESLATGASSFIIGIIISQLLRTRSAAIGAVMTQHGIKAAAQTQIGKKAVQGIAYASLGKAVYGAAAMNHVAKLLRTNVITGAITTAVITAPDFYRVTFSRSISWQQFGKNLTVNAGSIATGTGGWFAGAATGAAVGSVVPIIGTAAGGIFGAIVGALAGGVGGGVAIKKGLDCFVKDDAQMMLEKIQEVVTKIASEYMLSKQECKKLANKVKKTVNLSWLQKIYASNSRNKFVRNKFEPFCKNLIKKRPHINLPDQEIIETELENFANEVNDDNLHTGEEH